MSSDQLCRFSLAVGVIVLLSACSASKNITQTQQQLRKIPDYRGADASSVSEKLDTYRKEEEDKVLYHLEEGMLHHYQENWEQSSKHLKESEQSIEKFYTKSINRNVQAMLVNDLRLPYDGEAYEDIYLNLFNCLNYLHREDWDGALVEVRRTTHKLGKLQDRYKGQAEAVSQDTAQAAVEQADEELEDVDLIEEEEEAQSPAEIQQHSAMGRLIGTVLHAKNRSPDDARIELSQLKTATKDQGNTDFLSSFPQEGPETRPTQVSKPSLEKLTETEVYNTMLVAFSGQAPMKKKRKFQFNINIDEEEVQLDFAIPTLKLPETNVDRVRARVAGETLTVPLVEDMQETAVAMFEQKKSIIYTRAVIRSFLKAGATSAGQNAAEDELGEAAGWLAGQIGEMASSATAQADTRGWQTMPGFVHATVAKLPEGTHTVTYEFLSDDGQVLKKRTRQVEVNGPQDLDVAEAIYLE